MQVLLDLDKSLAKHAFYPKTFIKYPLTYLLYLNVLCALKAMHNFESSPLYVVAHVKYVLSSLPIQIFYLKMFSLSRTCNKCKNQIIIKFI